MYQIFRKKIENVPKWNTEMIDEEVDRIINGIDKPSTPKENFKFSLLNHSKEFTNWK